MNTSNHSPTCRYWVAALAIALLACCSAKAVPYASCITNNGGTVSFILNEAADGVTVVFDGGGPGKTNYLGALPKGLSSFSLGTHSSYEIHVTKSAPVAWTQISDDLNPLVRFYAPRGIGVNRNPRNLSLFGRVYVLETAAGSGSSTTSTPTESNRVVNEGVYILNADTSDALGQGNFAKTAGLGTYTFGSSSSVSAWKIEVGEDNLVYISDYLNANAGLYRMDADGGDSSGEIVLAGVGNTANPTVHTTISSSAIAKGSIATGDLTVWAIDGQWASGSNSLMRWNIGSTALPYNSPPTKVSATGLTYPELYCDLDIAPDNNFYALQYRANNDTGSIKVISPSGTTLWTSKNSIPGPSDAFLYSRYLKVSPDGTKLAIIDNSSKVWIVGLTNGPSGRIPDLSQTNYILPFESGYTTSRTSANTGREVAFDAAGNLYVGSSSSEKIRILSPGGTTTAITRSSGSFEVITPSAAVGVTASTATANETGPVNGEYTITRSGDVSGPLTIAYTMSGTATSGSDYAALPGSFTFAAGQTSTNLTLVVTDDSQTEYTETAILSITPNSAFNLGTSSATISIRDNETPEVHIATTQPVLLEGVSVSRATLQLTRKGLLSAITVNIGYSGTAARAADFSGSTSVSLATNAVTKTFNLSPIDDGVVEGNESAIASVISATGYVPGSTNSATVTIIDDEMVPGTVLFADKFDISDTSTNWALNYADYGQDALAEFAFDYGGTNGIPEAPSSSGSFVVTKGLKMKLNQVFNPQYINGFSLSPLNLALSGNYRLRFDMWMNYNGNLKGGGPGSTEHVCAGIGTTGTEPVWAGGNDTSWTALPAANTVAFFTDGDGGMSDTLAGVSDLAVFAGGAFQGVTSGVYAAGTAADARGNGNPYYAPWAGGIYAPVDQTNAYKANVAGATAVGTFGFAWHKVTVTKQGSSITWDIDGYRIATVDASTLGLPDNVFVGYNDQYISSTITNRDLCFAILDNVKVESLTPPPAPAIVLDSPTNGASFTKPAPVNLAATVTDNGNIISKVQFFDGTTLVGEDATAPYTYSWSNASTGSHTVKARVLYNLSGSLDSAASTISVIDLTPPNITGITPGPGGSFSISGTGGVGSTFVLYKTTSLAAPVSWIPVTTNSAGTGSFSFNIPQGADLNAFFKVLGY